MASNLERYVTVPNGAAPILGAPLDGTYQDSELVPDIVAAKILSNTPATLRRWRHEGRHLRYYKVGASVRYRVSELHKFLSQCAVEARKADTAAYKDMRGVMRQQRQDAREW
jgi:Helix-turn-helix domain